MEDIIHKPQYISLDDIKKIRFFYNCVIDDTMNGGPVKSDKVKAGVQGFWNRPLRLEYPENPVHKVMQRLREDFGDFEIVTACVAYMSYPYGPHTDTRSWEFLRNYRKNYRDGWKFLIPLAWKKDYQPGTVLFSNPPRDDESLYEDHSEWLPELSCDSKPTVEERATSFAKELGVKSIIKWQQPGDLVAWKTFQWHCSLSPKGYKYDLKSSTKEFLTIEVGFPKSK
tara:strand:+ start:539 stop:1216 length:678 start_codon:yes stop_codon:yes gene_type:complete